MKIAIHQPNYIPWIGYFYKISQVDKFIILDNAKYSKGSIINRNKIKNANGGITMLTIPIHYRTANINEITIFKNGWEEKHWKTIFLNYKKTPYFNEYKNEFEKIFLKKWDILSNINITLIKLILSILNINTEIIIASELKKDFGFKNDRIVNICKYLNADEYLSGNGAKKYNIEEEYNKAGIKLSYTSFVHPIYNQLYGNFEPNMSIIDMIFNDAKTCIDFFHKK